MIVPSKYREYSVSVLFFVIPKIKDIEPAFAFSSLARLNQIIAGSELIDALGTNWIGTTISGLFVLVPDEVLTPAHAYLPNIFSSLSAAGVPVRCGVAWGSCLCFQDADGELNFVGRPINLAARLAYSDDNAGCLLSTDYEQYAQGFVGRSDTLNLKLAPLSVIRGKSHDSGGFSCRTLNDTYLHVSSVAVAPEVHAHGQEPQFSAGVVLAYDLPKFSAGDNSQLSKRVRSLVNAIQELKENHPSCREASVYFCPGGDGGVMVLANVRQEAGGLAKHLAQSLVVESEYKEASIGVEARLGVHYGSITLYRDAAGRLRPTGPSCFIADDLISDAASRASGLVFSESLRHVISHGSDAFLRHEFDELPPLESGPAGHLGRYVPKCTSGAPPPHPLIQQLFGPTSSWQPEEQ